MSASEEAESHLRVIRSLMEKATVYRAISTQAAMAGAILGLLFGLGLTGPRDVFVAAFRGKVALVNAEHFGFQLKWAVALVLSVAVNCFVLYKGSKQRGEPFVSPGMRMALRAMIPPLLCGAVFTSFTPRDGLPQAWLIFYGLALISTSHFSPESLKGLGWCFLISGLTLIMVDPRGILGIPTHVVIPDAKAPPESWPYPDVIMAATFGGFHLVYALNNLVRGNKTEAAVAT